MLELTFTGDLNLSGIFYDKVSDNIEIFSSKILEIFLSSDYTIANLEGCTTDRKNYIREDINISSPKNSINYLKNRKINIFNLANNHIFDCGVEGFIDTKNNILENNLNYNGAGSDIDEASKIIYRSKNNVKVAIISIAFNEGLIAGENKPGIFCINNNMLLLRKRVHEAKKNANWVVVNYHGGEEYSFYPSPSKRKLLRNISNLDNVDVVISHHSHTFQGIEKTKSGKLIFYSLGNFIFDFYSHKLYKNTSKGALVKFNFTEKEIEYSLFPIEIDTMNGKIINGDMNFVKKEIKNLSDFTNYWNKWLKDSYRLIFDNKAEDLIEKKNTDNDSLKALKNNTFLSLLFNLKFYKRVFLILKNENERYIYSGAVIYKILLKLKLVAK